MVGYTENLWITHAPLRQISKKKMVLKKENKKFLLWGISRTVVFGCPALFFGKLANGATEDKTEVEL